MPRAHQRAAHALRAVIRFLVLVWHRRAGKTVFAVVELVLAAAVFEGEAGRFGYICPFLKQAKEAAWEYVKRYSRPIPGVKINESELSVTFRNGAVLRLYGADHPDSLRGGYFDGVVLDEVGQMKREIWAEIIRPMLADRKGWALFIGTPKGVNLFSELYFDAVSKKAGDDWDHDLKTWRDTDALDPKEVEAARRAMPPQLFAQEFECDFFAAQENVLCSLEVVREAMRRDLKPPAFEWAAKVIGVDVARFGDDKSAIARRQGRVAFQLATKHGLDTMKLAGLVATIDDEFHAQAIFVDVTGGLGAGPYDRLRELGRRVIPVDFGAGADSPRYRNKRTEMWVGMAEWCKDGCLPDDAELQQDLVSATYDFNSSAQLVLDPKDAIKERLGRSPDKGDALACTFFHPVAPPDFQAAGYPGARHRDVAVTEYDPYAS